MKIRIGFVSNSSSSSFCIFGTYLSLKDIGFDEEAIQKQWANDYDGKEMVYWQIDEMVAEFLEALCKENGLVYARNSEDDWCYLGLEPESLGMRETGSEFQNRAKKAIKLVSGQDCIPGWHYGEIYY